MTKPPQILIPNGTSPNNIGDLAMLTVLINLLSTSLPTAAIVIHSTEAHLHTSLGPGIKNTLYSYVAFTHPRLIIRIARLIRLIFYYFIFKFKLDRLIAPLTSKDLLFNLCLDYKHTSVIVFAGGGYLRSQPGISQSLNLLMLLFMIAFAKLFSNRKIIAPISFGPFAYLWQEHLSAAVLQDIDIIAARESISFAKLSANHIRNVILSADHALLLGPSRQTVPKSSPPTLGLTLRQWFPAPTQSLFEAEIIKAISNFAKHNNYVVQPILQVDAPLFGDIDKQVTDRVCLHLKRLGVKIKPLAKVTDLLSAADIYSSVEFLLGMRMHSNILAATQNTPYVAISYEYKTEGISKLLGMARFCIRAEDVTASRLTNLLVSQNRQLLTTQLKLKKNLSRLQSREKRNWANILTSLN